MILKAFIKELPEQGKNIYKVRIPFMEDNTNHEMVFSALLCNQPGEYNGYKVGDCVYVIFENDKMDVPVIMGKLYTGADEKIENYHVVNNLNVTGTVTLPSNVKIGGYTTNDLFELTQGSNNSSGGASLDYILYGEWYEVTA